VNDAQGGASKTWILIAAAVCLIVGGGAIGGFFVWKFGNAGSENSETATAEGSDKTLGLKPSDASPGEPATKAPESAATTVAKQRPAERAKGSVAAFKSANRSVVHLSSATSSGTGILLNSAGLILTNAHVLDSPVAFQCRLDVAGDDQEQKTLTFRNVRTIGIHPRLDLALVTIDPSEHDAELEPARILWEKAVSGQKVFAIGNPSTLGDVTLTKTITEGLVSGVDRRVDGRTYYQISAAINPGNSGGPITNEYGDVLGVVTLRMPFASDVGFAIPLHDLDLSDFVTETRRRGNRKVSDSLTERGISLQGSYYSLVESGMHRTSAGRLSYSLAMGRFQNALEADPTNWRPYIFIGRLVASQRKYKEARGYLSQSLELDPWDNISAYEALGTVLEKSGYDDRALAVWREAASRFPGSGAVVWNALADYHASSRQHTEAALCCAAGLYSLHERKNQSRHSHLLRLLRSSIGKIENLEEANQVRVACYGIATEIDRMNAVAKQSSKARHIALREDFFDVAKTLGLELRGGPDGAAPKRPPLPNGLLQYPPPGVDRVESTGQDSNDGSELRKPDEFVVASNASAFSKEFLDAIATAKDLSADMPAWMTPLTVTKKSTSSGSPKPTVPVSTPAPVSTVEPIVVQVSPLAKNNVSKFRLSPDGTKLVAIDDYKVKVWNREGALKWNQFAGHDRARHVVNFSSDGHVATSDSQQTLIWDVASQKVKQALGDSCEYGAFTADNTRFLMGGSSIKLWSCDNGQLIKKFGTKFSPYAISVSENGETFGTLGSGGKFDVRNMDDGTTQKEWTVKGGGFSKGLLAWRANLAIVVHIKLVQIVDTLTGKILFRHNFSDSISSWATTPDGNTVVFLHPKYARILNLSNREKPRWVTASYGNYAYHRPMCSLSEDGSLMATTARGEKAIEIWDVGAMVKQGGVKQDAMDANNRIWQLVSPGDAKPSAKTLSEIQAACKSDPRSLFFNTLGVTHYRAGQYEETIAACTRAIEVSPDEPFLKGKPYPGDYIFIAMAHAKLGDSEEATRFKNKAVTSLKGSSYENDKETLGFLKELDVLLADEQGSEVK
jgi:S1-C subfamily serine protease/Flp pilus assembly protein TadD